MLASVSSRWMRRFSLILMLVVALFAFSSITVAHADTVISNPTLPATFAWPSWWSGTWGTNDCNGSEFNPYFTEDPDASVMQTWRGIQACAPRPQDQGGQHVPETMPNGGAAQYMFECTELSARYLQTAYGIKSLVANGGQFAYNYATATENAGKFAYYVNGTDNVLPQEGDVVSMTSSDENGHTAVITSLTVSDGDPGDGYIGLIDQNGSPNGVFSLTIEDYEIQEEPNLGFHVTDWIHPLVGIENSPIVSINTQITSIDALDRTRAWLAGHEFGNSRVPVTFYFDGSSWIKYPPQSQGYYVAHDLTDIAIGNDGKVWAVGDYFAYPRWKTLTYRLDMTQQTWVWVKVNSQDVGAYSNYLNAVEVDSSGAVWAAGRYGYTGGNYPLIEKWNGSAFVDQGVSIPPGVTSGSITDISFSSGTNGWAVGSLGGYVYHYDGSSWVSVALPGGVSSIQDVTAVSDNEAWGIGFSSQNLRLLHYTTANGWQEDTSFTFPTSTALYAIDSEGPNNTWIVGSCAVGYYGQPYFARYDGSVWQSVSAQTYTYPAKLVGVSIYGGYVWAAGIRTSSYTGSMPYYPIVLVK